MKSAKFKLEPVLKYREYLEDNRKREFAIAKERLFNEEDRLSKLEYLREKSIIELQEKEENDITLREIGLYYTFVSQISREIDKQKEILKEVKKRFEEEKIFLLNAYKDRKSLEILKKKEKVTFDKEIKKKEQKNNDDVAIGKFLRRFE